MKKHIVSFVVLALTAVGAAYPVFAEKHSSSLEAHVHGLSELTIAVEGQTIELQFSSPAMNLVGFEHRASSEKEIATVQNIESILRQPQMLFTMTGADCKAIGSHVDSSSLTAEDHHSHTQDEHKHHYDHDDHDDHVKHESHSEIVANYNYNCTDTAGLESVKVLLFDAFSGIEMINVLWVSPAKQGSVKLTANNTDVQLR